MRNVMLKPAATAAALAALLVLSGCGAGASTGEEVSAPGEKASAAGESRDPATGSKCGPDVKADPAWQLPSSFPSDVPLPNLEGLHLPFYGAGGGRSVVLETEAEFDVKATEADLRCRAEAAGYSYVEIPPNDSLAVAGLQTFMRGEESGFAVGVSLKEGEQPAMVVYSWADAASMGVKSR
ncbi:hypothetical protein [Nocardioides yefusunii]|uniref:Lipoprotein n=1 Tax=Nocardioides yefusunii TaxID=2500546 RepID=A0ABW1R2N4_9ACTN|nr:hypothetical protein [Nocardioides yefusunii]